MLAVSLLLAQVPSPATFPDDFLGDWAGKMQWSKAGEQKPTEVAMRFSLTRTTNHKEFEYLIVYGERAEDTRPYLLREVDAKTGKWEVDERNGAVLSEQWVAHSLNSVFKVGKVTLCGSIQRIGKNLLWQITTYGEPTAPDGAGVICQPVLSIQRAVLSRKRR